MNHDPLCRWTETPAPHGGVSETCGYCDAIARVRADQDAKSRADEREQIAQALESWGKPEIATRVAAYIARNGGRK